MTGAPARILSALLPRNEHARRLHAALADAGITVAAFYRYARPTEANAQPVSLPGSISLETRRLATLDAMARGLLAVDPEDPIVVATHGREVVGRVVVSPDSPTFVPELDGYLDAPGGYVWRLLVDPDWREMGVGTALLRRATVLARDRGVERLQALVAVDNVPSRHLFEGVGFARESLLVRVGLPGFDRRFERSLEGS